MKFDPLFTAQASIPGTRWVELHLIMPVIVMLVVVGCRPAPPYPIHFGSVECAYCHMVVSDRRFAAELVTKKGRVYYFDSIECLASFVAERQVAQGDIHSMWVSDFAHPEQLVPAPSAFYLKTRRLHSPMQRNLIAFASSADRAQAIMSLGGTELSWPEIIEAQHSPGSAKTPG